MAETTGRPTVKERMPSRIVGFIEDHPVWAKAYVPTIVTATLLVQIIQGCN